MSRIWRHKPIGAASGPGITLKAAGLRPSRRRGQNFLAQPAVAEKIVALADLQPGTEVLEIGPGLGILSERILAHPIAKLWLVELDRELAARLRSVFSGQLESGAVEILTADFLSVKLTDFVTHTALTVVGNLPFNVATQILKQLSEQRGAIARMVLMFQREVGLRLRSRPGDGAYGALSLLTALEWEIPQHFRVEAGSFHPRPKVDAEVLCFIPKPPPLELTSSPMQLKKIIRAGFAVRRKSLRNALSTSLDLDRAYVEAALALASISLSERAENLSLTDFVRLANSFGQVTSAPA